MVWGHIAGEVVESEFSLVAGLSDGAGALDASGVEGEATLVLDVDVSDAALFVVDVVICVGVEVEETNGGAFWTS